MKDENNRPELSADDLDTYEALMTHNAILEGTGMSPYTEEAGEQMTSADAAKEQAIEEARNCLYAAVHSMGKELIDLKSGWGEHAYNNALNALNELYSWGVLR